MIDQKKNSFLPILLFFFTALSWSQVFEKAALKVKATGLYYQGIFPNVEPALALYEDYNSLIQNFRKLIILKWLLH